MKNDITQEVLTYWESLRQGRLVPKRSEIDPHVLRKSLNYTFILEAIKPDNIRFHLAGSILCSCMGMEMRGMPAFAMLKITGRSHFKDLLQSSLSRPEVLDFQLTPTAHMVLLPMSDDNNAITHMLGCIDVDPNLSDFPARFCIRSAVKTRISATKPIIPKLMSELAEDQQPITPDTKKATSTKPPFLRIIK